MSQFILPQQVLEDLNKFINENYQYEFPHSIIIAKSFCNKFKDYEKKFGIYAIIDAIENGKMHCIF